MNKRVLVVGTTPDYVDLVRRRYPGRALFLTERSLRLKAREDTPDPSEEVLADFDDTKGVMSALDTHLARNNVTLSGIACYDDESLSLASALAKRGGLPFAEEKAIRISRSKFHSKRAWIGAEVPCPRVQIARDEEALEAVVDRLGLPIVLKPLTGSGSELVFWFRKREDARKAFRTIRRKLAHHPDKRMYPADFMPGGNFDPRQDVVAEESFAGPEYSCDFLLFGQRAQLVRLAGKIISPHLGTGTAFMYYIPDRVETGIARRDLESQLALAAASLGFETGIFMADFISHRGKACFLEVSPRPAGDCLPWLVQASGGVDTLGLALDMAEGKRADLPDLDTFQPLAAVRLFAREPGVLKNVDTSELPSDPRVVEVTLYRRPGHRIVLPPGDYGSRILGHIIFRPESRFTLHEEGVELESLVEIDMES
jgi:biotin carboxylase